MRGAEHDKTLYELSQRRYAISLLPFRAEPRGFLGLKEHSCGIPCLIPSHASIAPLISRLVTEPQYFIGKPFLLSSKQAEYCFRPFPSVCQSVCIFAHIYRLKTKNVLVAYILGNVYFLKFCLRDCKCNFCTVCLVPNPIFVPVLLLMSRGINVVID